MNGAESEPQRIIDLLCAQWVQGARLRGEQLDRDRCTRSLRRSFTVWRDRTGWDGAIRLDFDAAWRHAIGAQ